MHQSTDHLPFLSKKITSRIRSSSPFSHLIDTFITVSARITVLVTLLCFSTDGPEFCSLDLTYIQLVAV